MSDFVPTELNNKAELYRQRNELYGDTYKQQGGVMKELFPLEMRLRSTTDHNRYAIFQTMVSKMCRYAANFCEGGHEDSLDDISVYAMMLKELDVEQATKMDKYKEDNSGL